MAAMDAAAARGVLALQHCTECGAAQYPPRDACRVCLSGALAWTEAPDAPATLLAACEVHHTIDGPAPPQRVGLVALPGGVTAVCFLDSNAPTLVRAALDAAGRAVLFAA